MGDWSYWDGLMQKRRNSIANALGLCLFYNRPSIKVLIWYVYLS